MEVEEDRRGMAPRLSKMRSTDLSKSHATLTVLSWNGADLPMIGHYVKAARGRTAFLIVEVRRPKKPCGYVARFVCERHSPASLPKNAVVHGWQWSKRK